MFKPSTCPENPDRYNLTFGEPNSRDPVAVDAHVAVADFPEPVRVQGKPDKWEYNHTFGIWWKTCSGNTPSRPISSGWETCSGVKGGLRLGVQRGKTLDSRGA